MLKNTTCFKCGGTSFNIEVSDNNAFHIIKCTVCGNKQPLSEAPTQIPDITSPFDKYLYPQNSNNQKCLFDGLPPGTYGLVCNCPKCRTYC